MKLLIFSLLLVGALLSTSVLADTAAAPSTPAPIQDLCNGMCNARCAKAGIPKRCLTYCCICYSKCKCVPSGTYGNKSECPCYRDMLNSKGKPKCP